MEPTSDSPGFAEHKPAYTQPDKMMTAIVRSTVLDSNQLLPGSAGREQLGNIVTTSHISGQALLYPTTVLTSTTLVARVEVRDDYGRVFLPQPECAVFTGISDSVGPLPQANAWPNTDYAMYNFPISIIPLDYAYSDDTHSVTTFAIRNNTAADVSITLAIRWRLVVNSAAEFQRSDSTST